LTKAIFSFHPLQNRASRCVPFSLPLPCHQSTLNPSRRPQDFSLYGSYRLIRSVSDKLATETFGAVPDWAAWVERIREAYSVAVFDERDPKE
jgi:hypothetical protein